MSEIKAEAMHLIKSLPEDVTWDDIMYEVYVKKKIREGLDAADKGEVVSHEEVKKRFAR